MNTIQETKYDGIIFDMDGVLVDVRNSYREAIRQTTQQFVKEIITDSDVAQIKTIAGLNNDWDTTALLIQLKNNRSIAMQEIKQLESIRTSPLYKQVVEYFDALYFVSHCLKKNMHQNLRFKTKMV